MVVSWEGGKVVFFRIDLLLLVDEAAVSTEPYDPFSL